MKVKLIKDVIEGGQLKVAQRRNKNWFPPTITRNGKGEVDKVEESEESEYTFTPFTKGAVIEMSAASADKYVEQGLAVYVEEKAKEKKPVPKAKVKK